MKSEKKLPNDLFVIQDTANVIQAEYKILDNLVGVKNYSLIKQSLSIYGERYIDRLDIETKGEKLSFFFDVTAAFLQKQERKEK